MSARGPISREGVEGRRGESGPTGATGATGAQGPRSRNTAAAFLILLTFCFFGFVRVDQQTKDVESLTNRTVMSIRDGCEGLNVIRENQGSALEDQIKSSARTLKRSLGPLEPFRKDAEASLELRREAVARLRRSVREYPVKGRPFAIDCVSAYP